MFEIIIIAAISKNRAIGKDNKLPWYSREDLDFFKGITTGCPCIMGRRTFESLSKPLDNRTNIVVSKTLTISQPGVIIASSVPEAICHAKQNTSYLKEYKIFIIGGQKIYEQFINRADSIILTSFDIHVKNADAFFPDFNLNDFEQYKIEHNLLNITEYKRKK